jgi:hypothetical protein
MNVRLYDRWIINGHEFVDPPEEVPNYLPHTDSAEERLQSELGFCACGMPGETHKWMLRGIELLTMQPPDDAHPFCGDKAQWEAFVEEREALKQAHFGGDGGENFFAYWLDNEGYSTHGSVITYSTILESAGELLVEKLKLSIKEQEADEGED